MRLEPYIFQFVVEHSRYSEPASIHILIPRQLSHANEENHGKFDKWLRKEIYSM